MKEKKPRTRRYLKLHHNDPSVMTTDDRIKALPDFKDRIFDPGGLWVRASQCIKK